MKAVTCPFVRVMDGKYALTSTCFFPAYSPRRDALMDAIMTEMTREEELSHLVCLGVGTFLNFKFLYNLLFFFPREKTSTGVSEPKVSFDYSEYYVNNANTSWYKV